MPSSVSYRRNQLSGKQLQALYELWQNSKDGNNKVSFVSRTSGQIGELVHGGYIRLDLQGNIEFLKRGKDVISKLILGGEHSVLEKNSKPLDFDSILHQSFIKKRNSSDRVASQTVLTSNQHRNWFQRTLENN